MKYGKFVLPNENEHEVIIFDKLVVPIPLDEDKTEDVAPTSVASSAIVITTEEELAVELAVDTMESATVQVESDEASQVESDDGFVEVDVPSSVEDETEDDVLSIEKRRETPEEGEVRS